MTEDRGLGAATPQAGPLPVSPPSVPEPENVLQPVPVLAVPPPATRGRAGRDLPAAVAVGAALAAAVLASLYFGTAPFVGLVALAAALAVLELANAFAARGVRVPRLPLVAGAVAMPVAARVAGPDGLLAALLLTGLGVVAWRLRRRPRGYLRDVTAGVFSAAYVPFLAGFAVLMAAGPDGPDRVVVFVLVVVASDVGGYAAGVLSGGRHAMAPGVSPKKSWEGFAGSLALSAALGALAVPLLLGGAWWEGLVVGLAAVATATLGDLGESLIKRDLGIKDMGTLLPGHGGLMDRLDSLLPAAPVTYLLLASLVPA